MELLVGCGNRWEKRIKFDEVPPEWIELKTMDIDPKCNPSIMHDLEDLPLPFDDNLFDEVHAYDVLEHTGQQGDWFFFFNQFYEFWRIMKPGAFFCGVCPLWDSKWAWGDPGHRRIISAESLVFLSQKEYKAQVGNTPMTDYRFAWEGDFDLYAIEEDIDAGTFGFVLQAVK